MQGTAKVLKTFDYKGKSGSIVVAGLNVLTGSLKVSQKTVFRVKRTVVAEDGTTTEEVLVDESTAGGLRRFKDVVNEVHTTL
jgi:hypothetical protein